MAIRRIRQESTGINLLHNGAINVAQRGTSATSKTTSGYYTADRWYVEINNTAGTWNQTIENDAPSGTEFKKSLKMAVATGGQNASLDASDYCLIQQRVEGQNLQHLKFGTSNAESLTASFWVKTNVTGTHVLNLYSNDSGYHYTSNYSISSSGSWTKVTLTIPGDTVRAFDNDNARSLDFSFWLTAGSTWNGGGAALTSWTNTTNNLAAGQVNISAAAGNYFQLTGVQLEVGTTANSFQFKSYGQELIECQRYYEICPFVVNSAGQFYQNIFYKVQKRALPSLISMVSGTVSPATLGNRTVDYFTVDGLASINAAVSAAATSDL